MNCFELTNDQCYSILSNESTVGYIREAIPNEYWPDFDGLPAIKLDEPLDLRKYWPRLVELPEDLLIHAAKYVFTYASRDIHSFDSPKGEVVITTLAGVFGLWSDTTDWLFFTSEFEAIDFAKNNLEC